MKFYQILFLILILSLSFEYTLLPKTNEYVSHGESVALDITYNEKGSVINLQLKFYSFTEVNDYYIDVSESTSYDYNSSGTTRKIKPTYCTIKNHYYGNYYIYNFDVILETDNNYLLITPQPVSGNITIKPPMIYK